MLKNLLFYRLVIFNTLGLVALIASYFHGFITTLLQHDDMGVVYVIGALLALGIMGSLSRGWKVSQMMNLVKKGYSVDRQSVFKMSHNNEYLKDMAEWSVLIGLLGNVLGLLTALEGGQDSLLAGAGTAFGSTVAGILVAFWLGVNFTMIRTATGLLQEDVQ